MRYCLKSLLLAIIFNCSSAAFAQSESFEELKSLELIDQIYEHLDLYFVDEVAHGKLSKTAIDAMLKELDPYTVYYHEANIEDYRLMTTGQYGGIGALIGKVDNDTYITETYEANPAQIAGIIAGDKIIRIDKKSVVGKSVDEVSNALKGPKGTSVFIEVERLGKPLSFEIKRDEIKIPDIPYAGMVSEKTGYISLSSFTQTASAEVKKNILELQGKGLENLILDLRGNGGGLLMEAVKIVGFFVPKGQVVVSTKGRAKQENMVYRTLEEPIAPNMPLVVLIDEGSASASEIVSGALQDLDRAVVIGSTSYGKGLVQRTFDLKYGSKMKLTIAKYYTPSGRCVQRLEYYDDANEGKPKEIPDSLLQKFTTKNGRSVIDGRGIEPDIAVNDSSYSDYIKFLISKHLLFHFANVYKSKHDSILPVDQFSIENKDFESLKAFIENSNIEYSSPELRALEKIKTELSKKGQFDPVSLEFNSLTEKLKNKGELGFVNHQAEIKQVLEREIIGRYFYQKGQSLYSLKTDEAIKKATEVLNNISTYKSVLKITRE